MKRILLVDDEAGFTRLLKMNLEKTGLYLVLVLNESTKAIQAARQFQPNVILLDIVMPDMDGGDIAAKIQADPELGHIPIIMLTALVDQDEPSPGAVAQAGTLNVLAKPGLEAWKQEQAIPINMELLLQVLANTFEAQEQA